MWSVKHPVAWADRIAAGRLPVAGHEVIDPRTRELERVMLGIRLREGLDVTGLARAGGPTGSDGLPRGLASVVGALVAEGLLDPGASAHGRAVLTLRGRLMADAVTHALESSGPRG